MIYTVDECITVHWPFSYLDDENCIPSIEIFERGASDSKILGYTIENKTGLITADYKFALRALFHNRKVLFHKPNGDRYNLKLKAKKLTPIPRLNDDVVLP